MENQVSLIIDNQIERYNEWLSILGAVFTECILNLVKYFLKIVVL